MPSIVPERKKRKRKTKINDNEIIFVKPAKKQKKKSSLRAEQKLQKTEKKKKKKEKKIEKTRKKAIKGLIDFNKFIRDGVIKPGQRRSFDFKACNVKQEIVNSYQRWRRKKKQDIYIKLELMIQKVFYMQQIK